MVLGKLCSIFFIKLDELRVCFNLILDELRPCHILILGALNPVFNRPISIAVNYQFSYFFYLLTALF